MMEYSENGKCLERPTIKRSKMQLQYFEESHLAIEAVSMIWGIKGLHKCMVIVWMTIHWLRKSNWHLTPSHQVDK